MNDQPQKNEYVTEVAKLCNEEVFVLFCFAKKVPKKATRKRCTSRFRGGGWIRLLCYCGFGIDNSIVR